MSSSTNQNNNIYPKSCVYNWNTQIYWNTATNEYWEVFTKKHVCPNRVNNLINTSNNVEGTTTNTKPIYYSKKPWNSNQPKPKVSNSFELLTGPIDAIQKKYEILSNIVIVEYNGRIHGSQRDKDLDGNLNILVYYEVPEGKRDEVKQKFNNFLARNNIVLQRIFWRLKIIIRNYITSIFCCFTKYYLCNMIICS